MASHSQYILTCNAGSNSLKCALYNVESLLLIFRFEVDRIHVSPRLTIKDANGKIKIEITLSEKGYETALIFILRWFAEEKIGSIIGAGHRVVHGGTDYKGPVLITNDVEQKLSELIPLAPLHQPYNISLINFLAHQFPQLKQAACFDTAFHRTQPWLAQQFALPKKLVEESQIFRYGFHGLSYEYITQTLPNHIGSLYDKRIIIAHLGSGASLCALKHGKSFATSMGFTALDGLMMATRCGNLDPGVILYLLQEKQMNPKELETMLYQHSGLLGVSGVSGDIRDLGDMDNIQARNAKDLFCYMAAKELGGLITLLGGLDSLVFTGGMGYGDSWIRLNICKYLAWLGLCINDEANAQHKISINTESSPIQVLVLPTDEENIIAQQTSIILKSIFNN